MSLMRFSLVAGSALAAAIALSACDSMPTIRTSNARVVEMKAAMTAAKEVPPNKTSSGEGYAFMTYDEATRTLTWKVYYSRLSGPATAAHIHGPADASANAGVVINLGAPASPIVGSATLTETQAYDLVAGKWYINVHTQGNPGGEIRGQVMTEAW